MTLSRGMGAQKATCTDINSFTVTCNGSMLGKLFCYSCTNSSPLCNDFGRNIF